MSAALHPRSARSTARAMLTAAVLALVGSVVVVGAAACATGDKSGSGAAKRIPPVEDWRKQRPAPAPAPEPKLPVFQSVELKSGLKVFVVEEHALPIVSLAFVARTGSAQENVKEAGLADLTYDMLDEGAGGMNAVALATAFQEIGTAIEAKAGRESGSVAVEATKANLGRAMELLAAVAQKPTFANEDFDRVKGRHLASIQADEGDPGRVAADAFAAAAYGADHPYGHAHKGTQPTVEKLTASKAKKLWSDTVGPKTGALVFAGDVTLDEAKALAEQHFGKWRGSAKPGKPPVDVKPRGGVKLYLADFPGAPQTMVRVGRPLVAKGDPDEAPLLVFNEILGGMFSSRLNMKLREEKQWTYGAFSQVELRLGQGPFLAGADVVTASTADAVKEVMAQFDAMKTAPPSDAELALAKEGWAKSLTGAFSAMPLKVFAASRIFVHDLPLDYYQKRVDAVRAVTAADVQRVAGRALVNEELVVVLVGDKATIEAPVKALGLGDPVAVQIGTAPPAAK